MKRFVSLSVSLALIGNSLFLFAPSAIAAGCPDPKKDGKTIGKVVVGKTNTDVKYVDYEAGEALDPPNSPLNVGLSIRHMPLSSPIGSSLLVWHINYKGCEGKLNILNDKKIGFKFSIVDEKGFKQEFKISKKFQVKKGKYKSEWFQLNGPRQLTLVTCIGKVVNHHYEDNLVIIAVPLNGVDYTPSTTPSASASASATPTASVSLSTSPTSSHSPSSTN